MTARAGRQAGYLPSWVGTGAAAKFCGSGSGGGAAVENTTGEPTVSAPRRGNMSVLGGGDGGSSAAGTGTMPLLALGCVRNAAAASKACSRSLASEVGGSGQGGAGGGDACSIEGNGSATAPSAVDGAPLSPVVAGETAASAVGGTLLSPVAGEAGDWWTSLVGGRLGASATGGSTGPSMVARVGSLGDGTCGDGDCSGGASG